MAFPLKVLIRQEKLAHLVDGGTEAKIFPMSCSIFFTCSSHELWTYMMLPKRLCSLAHIIPLYSFPATAQNSPTSRRCAASVGIGAESESSSGTKSGISRNIPDYKTTQNHVLLKGQI